MLTKLIRARPWEHDRDYTTVDLHARDVHVSRSGGEDHMSISPELAKPVYIEIGGTVLRFGQVRSSEHYDVRDLYAKRGAARVIIPRLMVGASAGIIIGRETTPELVGHDPDVSRQHLRFVTMPHQVDIIDMASTHGTLVHTPNEPQEFTHADHRAIRR